VFTNRNEWQAFAIRSGFFIADEYIWRVEDVEKTNEAACIPVSLFFSTVRILYIRDVYCH
jgi:hypothetical protein